MARAMHTVDVFRALLDGCFIVDKYPVFTGKSEYKVMRPAFENQPYECAGRITEKQFHDLCSRGVIEFSGQQTRDEDGSICGIFFLVKGTD